MNVSIKNNFLLYVVCIALQKYVRDESYCENLNLSVHGNIWLLSICKPL